MTRNYFIKKYNVSFSSTYDSSTHHLQPLMVAPTTCNAFPWQYILSLSMYDSMTVRSECCMRIGESGKEGNGKYYNGSEKTSVVTA